MRNSSYLSACSTATATATVAPTVRSVSDKSPPLQKGGFRGIGNKEKSKSRLLLGLVSVKDFKVVKVFKEIIYGST